jgi:Flp pilus assembly protein TadB
MIQRLLSALLGLAFLIVVFLFTSLLVAAVITAGLLFWAWTRLRSRGHASRVIEGEYRVVRERNYHLRP